MSSKDPEIAVLQSQMGEVLSQLKDINTKLDVQTNKDQTYATKGELRTFKWITVPLIIILTAVITALVSFYFSHQDSILPQSTSQTTTTTTPTGSTSTTRNNGTANSSTPPAATANATSKSDSATPSDSQTSSSNGGVQLTLPKVP